MKKSYKVEIRTKAINADFLESYGTTYFNALRDANVLFDGYCKLQRRLRVFDELRPHSVVMYEMNGSEIIRLEKIELFK